MNKEANNTRHPLRRSPNNTVVDTAPKTETGVILAYAEVERKSGEFGQAKSISACNGVTSSSVFMVAVLLFLNSF